jgi:hypothetical protein
MTQIASVNVQIHQKPFAVITSNALIFEVRQVAVHYVMIYNSVPLQPVELQLVIAGSVNRHVLMWQV